MLQIRKIRFVSQFHADVFFLIAVEFVSNCVCVRVETVSSVHTLQRQNTEISKQIFPEKEYRGLSPNFHIHASVSDLYIPMISLPILLEEICRLILGIYKSLTDT
jgi:hypothetical protein